MGRFNNPLVIKVNISGVFIPQTFTSFEANLEKGLQPNSSGSVEFTSTHCGIGFKAGGLMEKLGKAY